MPILVTGAAGFIGYHVCAALLDRGERVDKAVNPISVMGATKRLAAPRTVNLEPLGRNLDELAELCAGERSGEAIGLLRHLVPEYHEAQIKNRTAR